MGEEKKTSARDTSLLSSADVRARGNQAVPARRGREEKPAARDTSFLFIC